MLPTERIRPSFTAMALAPGLPGSMVMILRARKTVISLMCTPLRARPAAIRQPRARSEISPTQSHRKEMEESVFLVSSQALQETVAELIVSSSDIKFGIFRANSSLPVKAWRNFLQKEVGGRSRILDRLSA